MFFFFSFLVHKTDMEVDTVTHWCISRTNKFNQLITVQCFIMSLVRPNLRFRAV